MRKSTMYLVFVVLIGISLGYLLIFHPLSSADEHRVALAEKRELVRRLLITDLCLFTDARYTRHISQADLHSAFQDHPIAMEHFPSGSFVFPPIVSRGLKDDMD